MSVARPVQAGRSSLHIAVSCSTQKPRLARDNTNDEWDLLLPQRDLFKRARDSAKKMQDPTFSSGLWPG